MSQITDDCFAFGGPLLRADAALQIIAERTPVVTDTLKLPLEQALGHVVAETVLARTASPPHDNAAVDGYAIRGGDISRGGETQLRIRGRVAAGDTARAYVGLGEALRIFTGAPMPEGADTVVMQEDVTPGPESIRFPKGLKPGANRRKAGEDIIAGTELLRVGRRLGPAELALAAAGGLAELPVHQRPRVAVLSTGDELRPAGQPLQRGQVYDANAPLLMGLLGKLGLSATHYGIVADDLQATEEALSRAAAEADLIITSGGASTGDEDHVRTAVGKLGAVHLWRLAIKPGRPLAFGHVGGTAFVGLPGNPVAVMACFLMFVRPLLDRLEGAVPVPLRRWPVTAGFDMKSKPDRLEWLRGTLDIGPDGSLIAQRYPKQGSGIIHSLTDSDGLIEVPEEVTSVAAGDRLGFISFREVMA